MNEFNEPEVEVVVRPDDEDRMVYLSVPNSLQRWACLEATQSVTEQAINAYSWRHVLRFPKGQIRKDLDESRVTQIALEGHLDWLQEREKIAWAGKSEAFADSARTAREDLEERLRGTRWFRIRESIKKMKGL